MSTNQLNYIVNLKIVNEHLVLSSTGLILVGSAIAASSSMTDVLGPIFIYAGLYLYNTAQAHYNNIIYERKKVKMIK